MIDIGMFDKSAASNKKAADYRESFCAECKHWTQGEIDPANLGAPRMGICQEQVHLIALPVRGPGGQTGVQIHSAYAQTPPNFPACSRFERAEELPPKKQKEVV